MLGMKTKSFSILMLLTMAFWLVACAGVETGRRRAEVGEVTGKDDSYKKDIPQREDSRRASGTAWEGTAPEGLAGTALGNEGLAGEAGTPVRAGAVPPPSGRGRRGGRHPLPGGFRSWGSRCREVCRKARCRGTGGCRRGCWTWRCSACRAR